MADVPLPLPSSQPTCVSQTPQTLGLDELSQNLDSQTSPQTVQLWGRLFPLSPLFGDFPHPLHKDVITIGRGEDCSIVLSRSKQLSGGELIDKYYKAYSKVHFNLTRNYTSTGCFTFIEDTSSNGTYVNGCKMGKNSKQFLSNNDEISSCHLQNRMFVYMETVDEKENIQMPDEIGDRFTIGKILGTGAFGEVRLAFEKRSCRRVAVKIINKEQLWAATGSTPVSDNRPQGLTPSLQTQREIEILRRISHPCIVGIELVADSALAFYLVLELAEGGDLHTRLKNNNGPLDEWLSKIYFLQIVSAVDYLHSNHVTHRDLKPENILMVSSEKETLCKVTDFGLAKLATTMSSMTTFCGTPLFVAPEVILAQGSASYTSAVDLWSLGVLLYFCLSNALPFHDQRPDLPLSQQILQGNYSFPAPRWREIHSEAKSLIRLFLQVDARRRISASDALRTLWLDDPAAKAFVDNLVLKPRRPKSPSPQFIPKPSSSSTRERCLTPTVSIEPRDEDEVSAAAADRPVEMIVAATNFSIKRPHPSSSESSGSFGDGCGEKRATTKRLKIDP